MQNDGFIQEYRSLLDLMEFLFAIKYDLSIPGSNDTRRPAIAPTTVPNILYHIWDIA